MRRWKAPLIAIALGGASVYIFSHFRSTSRSTQYPPAPHLARPLSLCRSRRRSQRRPLCKTRARPRRPESAPGSHLPARGLLACVLVHHAWRRHGHLGHNMCSGHRTTAALYMQQSMQQGIQSVMQWTMQETVSGTRTKKQDRALHKQRAAELQSMRIRGRSSAGMARPGRGSQAAGSHLMQHSCGSKESGYRYQRVSINA